MIMMAINTKMLIVVGNDSSYNTIIIIKTIIMIGARAPRRRASCTKNIPVAVIIEVIIRKITIIKTRMTL